MSTPKSFAIDIENPMRSLRETVGLTQEQFAAARGVTQAAQSQSERETCARLQLDTLISAASAAGGTLEIRFRPTES